MRDASLQGKELQDERMAQLALWCVPGVGPKTLASLRSSHGGLRHLLRVPVRTWADTASLLPAARRSLLRAASTLEAMCGRALEGAARGRMSIAFVGDPAYPERLAEVASAPPVLFYRGEVGLPRRRVAMVGTRHTSSAVLRRAHKLASEVARSGIGVVSGAADGVDRACHQGALESGGETWAFLGSALDELDPAQARLAPLIVDGGGTVFSEFPPGVRAEPKTFPRRNRLISGASQVVLVVRAGVRSGALHTSDYGQKQGRPILAMPGEVDAQDALGCNNLLRTGVARACIDLSDVWSAVGLAAKDVPAAPVSRSHDWSELSSEARQAYEALAACTLDFDELLAATRISSSALASGLCELELSGLVVQRPGKRYERI